MNKDLESITSCPSCYCNPERNPDECKHPLHFVLREGIPVMNEDTEAFIAAAERGVHLMMNSPSDMVREAAGHGLVLANALAVQRLATKDVRDVVGERDRAIDALCDAMALVLPFMDEDFPNGPNGPGSCVTPAYRAAYQAALLAVASARKPAAMDTAGRESAASNERGK